MTDASAPVYTLTSSSALSDDWVRTDDVLVDIQSPSPLGVFRSGGTQHALFVRADGVLCHLQPTKGAAAASWRVDEVGAAGVTQAAAGVQNDGTVHGFYTDASSLYHRSLVGGAWSDPTGLPLCTALSIATNATTGELVAYGIDTDGALIFVRQGSSGTWTAATLAIGTAMLGKQPVLLPTDAQGDWVMAVPGTAAKGGELDIYQGSPTAVTAGPMAVSVPNPVAEVVVGYWMENSALFLFTDSQQNLYTNVGSTANVVQIPNTRVASATAVVDISNNIHLYALDRDGTLSVVHQTGWDEARGPVWAPRIPLDLGLTGVFSDANPMDATALIAHDGEGALSTYEQDSASRTWTVGRVQGPAGAKGSYRLPTYRTQITIIDAGGNPAVGLTVAIGADVPTSVLANGAFQRIGPAEQATVSTNAQGRVTLSTIAQGVNPPHLTFSADGLPASAPVNAAEHLQRYLSGEGTLNASTSTALPQFGATTLAEAQVGSAPLAPAAKGNPDLAASAANGISSLLQMAAAGPSSAAALTSAGFELDLRDLGQPAFRTFATHDELRACHDRAFGLSSWWDSIADFFEDVWQGIKSGAMSIAHWVVDAANSVASFAVKVGDEIHNIVNQAIAGIKQVADMVQSVFAAIGAFIDELIDWLKMLFDWGAIKDTKDALKQALDAAFPDIGTQIETFRGHVVGGFFAKLESDVSSAFDSVAQRYSRGETLQSLLSPPAGSAALAASSVALSSGPLDWIESAVSDVQNNWLFEKVESFLDGDASFPQVDGFDALFSDLKTAFDTAVGDFEAALGSFWTFLSTVLTDPKDIATVGFAALLDAVKDAVLAALAFFDGIVEAVLDIAALAVTNVDVLMSVPFEIPFISSMLDAIGSLFSVNLDLGTMADAICLGLAIAVTLIYKIEQGSSSEPFPGGTLPGAAVRNVGLEAGAVSGDRALPLTAASVAGVWALFDTALDALPAVESSFLKMIDVTFPAFLGVLTWPGGVPLSPIPLDTDEDKASFANWLMGWAGVAISAGCLLWDGKIARKHDPVGKYVVTGFGAASLIGGIVASSLGAKPADIAANVLGPLSPLTQFLTTEAIEGSTEGASLLAKLGIDFFTGMGVAVATAAS